ncbi:Mammalian cell entry related domain protein [Fulvivirga imtechensis AK7]|uniref:Mammalian cell entry related domain protein n=1 Tax=Fulvivirga imtechensis AK7 TaxID=1237149 RepID=L8JMT6_9BACT|nr:MlaD family protein [Fulvivirga imtechensis]ELR70145.1 Mammalian cell entry related domain protein [Fulvivirga imtechensis AK7]
MKTKPIDNVKLGLFVLAGLVFLIFSLYMIGRNRNIFGSTFTVEASFLDVKGLTPGNNVRFAGIDVGTVRKIIIENDTSILVTMVIDKKARPYIKKNSIAAIGTDGLMGNQLVNISSIPGDAPPIEEGARIRSLKPVETDEMLRTLNTTNENIAIITTDLRKITKKINNSNSLWQLLSDTLIASDLKQAAVNIRRAGQSATIAGNEIADLARQMRKGEGLAGALIADTALVTRLRESLDEIHQASLGAAEATNDLQELFQKVKEGEGAAGALISDTLLVHKLNQSLENIEEGTSRFNENMEAMRHNFLFRGYFKKLEKQEKANKKER